MNKVINLGNNSQIITGVFMSYLTDISEFEVYCTEKGIVIDEIKDISIFVIKKADDDIIVVHNKSNEDGTFNVETDYGKRTMLANQFLDKGMYIAEVAHESNTHLMEEYKED